MDLPPAALAERARAGGRIGIDTEFMAEGRYQALLCLVQVAVPTGEGDAVEVAVLDPLDGTGFDHEPLAQVLADPEIEVIMHAGRQDVAILKRAWRTDVNNIFDTQIAAGFGGLRAQMGYGDMLHDVLGIRVPKTASFTRWDKRPLTNEQVEYARSDVEHLLQLATALEERLDSQGRLEWAREECRFLEEVSDERDPEEAWRRLPKVNQLSSKQRAVARALGAWREHTAREEDRPVGQVLADQALVEVARRRPADARALEQIRGIPQHIARRRARDLIDVVEQAQNAEPIPGDNGRRTMTDKRDAPLIALCEALVRARSLEAELAYELIASRADLTEIVVAQREERETPHEVRTLTGWRRDLVGAELLELLDGHHAIAIDEDGRLRVRPVG
ncbi:MAG: ribonuclease [Thermoleophilales bacterium]|nr:ribonuclease [Thermoleophilales bacterium]